MVCEAASRSSSVVTHRSPPKIESTISVFIGKHHGDGWLRIVDVARAAHGLEVHEWRCAVAVVVADVQAEEHLRAARATGRAAEHPHDVPQPAFLILTAHAIGHAHVALPHRAGEIDRELQPGFACYFAHVDLHAIVERVPLGFGNNFQRDGQHQMHVPKGRVAYEPNMLDKGAPRENPTRGFSSVPEVLDGTKLRKRSETFADHYSQARMFFRSMTEPEKMHIISAFAFELAHVETKAIRLRMLGHLAIVDKQLHEGISQALGMKEASQAIVAAVPARDLKPSPSLSILGKAPKTLVGRKIGVLITDGFDGVMLAELRASAKEEKAALIVIAPEVGGATDSKGNLVEADLPLSSAPSLIFDTVVVLASKAGAKDLATQAAAIDWVRDAFGHLMVVGHSVEAQALFTKAGIQADAGIISLGAEKSVAGYITAAKSGRIWQREASVWRPG